MTAKYKFNFVLLKLHWSDKR